MWRGISMCMKKFCFFFFSFLLNLPGFRCLWRCLDLSAILTGVHIHQTTSLHWKWRATLIKRKKKKMRQQKRSDGSTSAQGKDKDVTDRGVSEKKWKNSSIHLYLGQNRHSMFCRLEAGRLYSMECMSPHYVHWRQVLTGLWKEGDNCLIAIHRHKKQLARCEITWFHKFLLSRWSWTPHTKAYYNYLCQYIMFIFFFFIHNN